MSFMFSIWVLVACSCSVCEYSSGWVFTIRALSKRLLNFRKKLKKICDELKRNDDSFQGWGVGNGFREEIIWRTDKVATGRELGRPPCWRLAWIRRRGRYEFWSEADPTPTDLEARNTCWWGTLQVSTAQLLRYMSPISLRTLKAGRQGEKKAPILEPGRAASQRRFSSHLKGF